MRVRFHPDARAEVKGTQAWYYELSPLTATAFAHAIDTAVSRIVETPTKFPVAARRTRRLVLQRFPFNIFYLPGEREMVIVAVAHQRRRPGYWASRVSTS